MMIRVRTTITVTGFTETEALGGLPDLLEEFRHRPWMLNPEAFWDSKKSRLVVSVESECGNSQVGRESAGHFDEVWDCVIACIENAGEIKFEVDSCVSPGTA